MFNASAVATTSTSNPIAVDTDTRIYNAVFTFATLVALSFRRPLQLLLLPPPLPLFLRQSPKVFLPPLRHGTSAPPHAQDAYAINALFPGARETSALVRTRPAGISRIFAISGAAVDGVHKRGFGARGCFHSGFRPCGAADRVSCRPASRRIVVLRQSQ
jgi:hypothetical protein